MHSSSIFILFVILAVQLQVKSLYAGDTCGPERPGTCTLLSQCSHLLSEIARAGKPMPIKMRRRLQDLTCGFETVNPLVCCNEGNPQSLSFITPDYTAGTPRPRPAPSKPWDSINKDDTEVFDPIKPPPVNFGNDLHNNFGTDNDNTADISRHPNVRMLMDNNCGFNEGDRLIGGKRTRLYEIPWMVLLSYDSASGPKLSCGGTLIHPRYVLTAAHCVIVGKKLRLNGIILGDHDLRGDPDCERFENEMTCAPSTRNASIEEVIPHPNYSLNKLIDDIALIRLAEPADFELDTMKPVCLPITQDLINEDLDDKIGTVSGWGATEDGLQSPVLLKVDLPIVANKDCQDAYKNMHIHPTQLCAGGEENKDSCGGDSGGPLMYAGSVGKMGVRFVQRGIVSYGLKRCGIGGYPGVYTRVSSYMKWILDNMHE